MTATKPSGSNPTPQLAWLFGLSALLRLVVAAPLHEPVIFADEAAPMLMARAIVGHHPLPTMGRDVLYHVGPALLAAPWTALFGPEGAWRAVSFTNAFLLAALAPLVYLIMRDTVRAEPRLAFASAIIVSLYPAFVLETGFSWAESAVLPVVLLTFVLCQRMVQHRSVPWAVAFGVSAAAAYAVHPRLVPLLVLAPVALFLAHRWQHLPRRAAIAGVCSAAGVLVATRAANAWLRSTLYLGTPGTDEHAVVTRIFTSPVNLLHALASFAGQSWYLTVATFGLAPLGAWLLVDEVRKAPRRVDLLYLVGTVAALVTVSSLFVIDPKRVDQRVYGRYAETFLAVLLAAGVVAFGRRRAYRERIVAMVALPLALLAALVVGVGTRNFTGVVNAANILGIDHLVTLGLDHVKLDIVRITGVAVAGAAVVLVLRVALRRWGVAAGLVVVAALFGAATLRTQHSVIVPIHETRRATSILPAAVHRIEARTGVRVDAVDIAYEAGKDGGEFFGYQLLLPEVTFRPFRAATVPRGPWVLAHTTWPAGTRAGARLVYPEGSPIDFALWVLPGAEQQRLAKDGVLAPAGGVLDAADLHSTITPARTSLSFRRGVDVPKLEASVVQRGHAPWPASNDDAGHGVRVRADWYRPGHPDEVVWQNLAVLPSRLLPNETATVTIEVKTRGDGGAMPEPGRYELRFSVIQLGGAPVLAAGPKVTVELR